ncbi:hypothetical protein EW785_24210 [Salmonella enterica]|nr:hypothetical protein [Salmonella enterica]
MASKNNNEIATMAIHAGNQADPAYNAIFPPIVTASSFIQPNLNEGGIFAIPEFPTRPVRLTSRLWQTLREEFMQQQPLREWLQLI